MRSFGRGPRPFSTGGALAGAIAACMLMEGQLEADPLDQAAQESAPSAHHASKAPTQTVERGGFGNMAFSAAELDEGIAAGVFVCLIGTLFWWESRPPTKPKKRAGS